MPAPTPRWLYGHRSHLPVLPGRGQAGGVEGGVPEVPQGLRDVLEVRPVRGLGRDTQEQ